VIGFIRRSDLPVLVIGIIIAISLSVAGIFALLKFFPGTPENLALFIWICLMGISYAAALYIRKWIEKKR
jgi:hypothetical protein